MTLMSPATFCTHCNPLHLTALSLTATSHDHPCRSLLPTQPSLLSTGFRAVHNSGELSTLSTKAVARAHIVKEIEFAAKKDVINGKYLQMLQNEQQRQNIAQEFENKRIAHMKKMMTMPKAHAACPPLQPRNSQSARSYGSMKGSQTSSHEQIAQETAVEGPEGFSERQYVDDSPDVGESVGHLDARRSCTEEADRGDAEDVEVYRPVACAASLCGVGAMPLGQHSCRDPVSCPCAACPCLTPGDGCECNVRAKLVM